MVISLAFRCERLDNSVVHHVVRHGLRNLPLACSRRITTACTHGSHENVHCMWRNTPRNLHTNTPTAMQATNITSSISRTRVFIFTDSLCLVVLCGACFQAKVCRPLKARGRARICEAVRDVHVGRDIHILQGRDCISCTT